MTKRYAVLQKKFQELETQLLHVFSLPAENPCHQLLSEGIQQRIVFLNSLLSAEIASHPSKPHHLRHMEDRLARFVTAFRDWDDYRANGVSSFDVGSTCSCTESCLNDDGVGDGDGDGDSLVDMGTPPVFEAQESFPEEKSPEMEAAAEKDEERENKRVLVGMDWGVMASGMVVGAVLMGFVMTIRCFSFFPYIENGSFLSPT